MRHIQPRKPEPEQTGIRRRNGAPFRASLPLGQRLKSTFFGAHALDYVGVFYVDGSGAEPKKFTQDRQKWAKCAVERRWTRRI